MNEDKRQENENQCIRENIDNAAAEKQFVINMFLRLRREFDFYEAAEYAAIIKEFNCLI
jgi:hypothetical protein